MEITIVGAGYVGLVAALGFAEFGNSVVCLDEDSRKICSLNQGQCPMYEFGAQQLLNQGLKSGRLSFTTDTAAAIRYGELIFIAVGTPASDSGEADLSSVFNVAREIGRYIEQYVVVVDKSTVPVGTARRVKEIIRQELQNHGRDIPFDVASNPEFLREGKAVSDFLNPDRIVIGTDSAAAEEKLRKAYKIFERSNKPIVCTSLETAEMIKYATNSFLATKVAFLNEIANLCEKTGANVLEVAKAMGMDGRISSKFLHPGPGYGGSCFPKDTQAIASLGRKYGAPLSIVESVIASNQRQKELAAEKIIEATGGKGTLAILGLSFKAETDDVRNSPAIEIVSTLVRHGGFALRLYDPQAMNPAKVALGLTLGEKAQDICWCKSAKEALSKADAAVVLTEWLEFRSIDFKELKNNTPVRVIFDFRNIFSKNHDECEAEGIRYYGKGL